MLIGVTDKTVEFGERSVKHIESRGLNCLLELLETLYSNQQSYRKKRDCDDCDDSESYLMGFSSV